MIRPWRALRLLPSLLLLCVLGLSQAVAAPFDLAGPALKVNVTHAGMTLPITQTPSLSPGDVLSIKADLPPGQSVKYLLVAAFLRGATNPPPENWFFQAETWNKKGKDSLNITVPKGAEQLLIFFAPQTGGDFKTLAGAVRGRPGAFVRASQDLNQASLDRSRLDAFLLALRRIDAQNPDQLKIASPLLARSLTIKLNSDCLSKMAELQAACLMQGPDGLVLDDGHGTTLVQTLTSGDPASLTQQLIVTPQAGGGYYSPYIGAALDIARIMDSFHTAQYQYIPALAVAQGDQLSLVLNTPPSFHEPLSVLVAAMPAVQDPEPPPLEPVDPKAAYCLEKPGLVLPVQGAPLAFSTQYARDLVLRLQRDNAPSVDVPLKLDAEEGGLAVNLNGLQPAALGGVTDATVHGLWGFQPFDGPRLLVQGSRPDHWKLAADDQQSTIVGRDDTVRLSAPEAPCVEQVSLRQATGDTLPVDWKMIDPGVIEVTLPLKDAQPGAVTLMVKQYGLTDPDVVPLDVFAQAGQLDHFAYHAGDLTGVLKGSRLDEVKSLSLSGALFRPGALTTANGVDTLILTTTDATAIAALRPGATAQAKIALNDGRNVNLKTPIEPPRPDVALISKAVAPDDAATGPRITLGDKDDIPQGATLASSVQAHAPTRFSDHAAIDIGDADGAVLTTLTQARGLVLEDPHVAVATLDTAKALNAAIYGPIQFRVVDGANVGDWLPLATIVRLPTIRDLHCRGDHGDGCELSGSGLFLITALSNEPGFAHPVEVPEGFTSFTLTVPHPHGGELFLKLHDDPAVLDHLTLPPKGAATAGTNGPPAHGAGASAKGGGD